MVKGALAVTASSGNHPVLCLTLWCHGLALTVSRFPLFCPRSPLLECAPCALRTQKGWGAISNMVYPTNNPVLRVVCCHTPLCTDTHDLWEKYFCRRVVVWLFPERIALSVQDPYVNAAHLVELKVSDNS